MIAERDRIDARRNKLARDLARDAGSGGGVFSISHDKVCTEPLAQRGDPRSDNLPAGPADDVADEQH
jgi:hypothetical protein